MKLLIYFLLAITALRSPGSIHAQIIVYDNASGTPIPVSSTSSEPFTNNPVFGDSLVLSQGGVLQTVRFAVLNGSNGNILTGTATIRVFDNTVPYASGDLTATHPILATLTRSRSSNSSHRPATRSKSISVATSKEACAVSAKPPVAVRRAARPPTSGAMMNV